MEFIPITTRPFLPPKDDLYQLLDEYLLELKEGDVLLVTSKILAIHQGRTIKKEEVQNKDKLVRTEADTYIPREEVPGEYVVLTIKDNTLIPSAGIDESNGNGYYTLWPNEPNKAAKEICMYLKEKYGVEKIAVVIADSHTTPMRYGVVGISIGFFGMEPLRDYRGTPDIFGRKLTMTKANIVDALAAVGTLLMGEGSEQTPLLIVRGAEFIKFTDKETHDELNVPEGVDIYTPLLKAFQKR